MGRKTKPLPDLPPDATDSSDGGSGQTTSSGSQSSSALVDKGEGDARKRKNQGKVESSSSSEGSGSNNSTSSTSSGSASTSSTSGSLGNGGRAIERRDRWVASDITAPSADYPNPVSPKSLPPLDHDVSMDIDDSADDHKIAHGATGLGLTPLPPLTFMTSENMRLEKEYAWNKVSVTLVTGPFAVFVYSLVILIILKNTMEICAPRCNCTEAQAWIAEFIIGATLQSPLLFNYAFSTHTALAGFRKVPWVTIGCTTACLALVESLLSGGLMRVMDDGFSLIIRQVAQFLILLGSAKIGRTWRQLLPALPILKFQLFVLGGLTILFLTPLPATGDETYITILLVLFPIYLQIWEKCFTKFCQDKKAPKLRVRLWHITMAKQTIAGFEGFRLVTLLELRYDMMRFWVAFILGIVVDVFARNDMFLVSFYYVRNLWRRKKNKPKLERTPGPFKWSFLRGQYDSTYIAPAVLVAINITRFYPFASVPRLLDCSGRPTDTYLPSPAILVILIVGEIVSDFLTRLIGVMSQKHKWWWSPYCEDGPPPIHIKNKGISVLTVVGAGMQALQTIGAGAVWLDALYTGGSEE